ncbi:MAG: phosphatidate cytidylyltransferase [Ottowia sp.]|nr:phosphatidate cytidylyltransferase [Ottowia sp.]
MLMQRVATALILVAILAALLFAAPPAWFDAALLVAVAAAAWEWGRMNTPIVLLQWACVPLTLLLCVLLLAVGDDATLPLWALAALLWLLGASAALRAGVAGWPRVPMILRVLAGPVLLALGWLAAVHWRAAGINALLSVLVLVWAADTGAYAAGRRWGRHKLAPAISPGKTWEGVAGGFCLAAAVAILWFWLDTRLAVDSASIYTRLHALGAWGLAVAVALLVGVSVAGDLFESLVKRSAGVKDSSALLPGHGGVLDRIDALLPVLPMAWLLVQLAQTGGA